MDRYTPTMLSLVPTDGIVHWQEATPRGFSGHPSRPPRPKPDHQGRAGPLQAPWGPFPEQPAHYDPQVMTRHLQQIPLGHCPQAPQPTPPTASGLADMRERPLHILAPPLLQTLAPGPLGPPPVRPVRPLPPRRLIGPDMPLGPPLLADIGPHTP